MEPNEVLTRQDIPSFSTNEWKCSTDVQVVCVQCVVWVCGVLLCVRLGGD